MSLNDICAMLVYQLAKNDCALMLWTTAPHLQQSFKVMDSWGFTYKTAGAWVKTTSGGKIAFGTGYIFRSAAEFFLIGTIGSPKIHDRSVRNVLMDQRREHSRKPDSQYEIIERLFPNGRYCELFSRTDRPGWDSWGFETGKFII